MKAELLKKYRIPDQAHFYHNIYDMSKVSNLIAELKAFLSDNNLKDAEIEIETDYYHGSFDCFSLHGSRPKTEEELQHDLEKAKELELFKKQESKERRKQSKINELALYNKLKKKLEKGS